ncbi:MAG: ethanolamine permease [Gemmatimonadales bacterium]
MAEPVKAVGGVTYENVDKQAYLQKRGLKRHARVLHLWALGVGAVISGEFSGWNFGLENGFWGLLIANLFITVMYFGLIYCIAEMSPALPHTGAAYSFARSSMGPWGGYITGLAENMEYILTPAVIVVFCGDYLEAVFPGLLPRPAWWLILYAIFTGLTVWGVEISFRFAVFITILAMAILVLFYVAAIPHVDFNQWALSVPAAEGGTRVLPKGIPGIFYALPFAIWFYLAIEEVPLAAEETMDPARDVPKGIIAGMITLTILAFLVLFFNSSIAPGAEGIKASGAPLNEGLKTIFGAGLSTKLLSLVALAGLIASFHTIIFAFGRQIYSLSRAGYFPRFFSLTHHTRKTPWVALVSGSVMGYVVALVILQAGMSTAVGATLLNMAVFGAVISYGLQTLSFILLRIRRPSINRPYRSPWGIPGAVIAGVIALVTLIALFLNPAYKTVIYGVAVWYLLGLVYFVFVGRHKLVAQAPEEEFALLAEVGKELKR